MNEAWKDLVRAKATGWWRILEGHLQEMYQLETHTRISMLSMQEECKREFARATITFRCTFRDGNDLADAIHRVRLRGARRIREGSGTAPEKPRKNWVKHLVGPPTRAEMFMYVRDVGRLPVYTAFYDRATCLNSSRHALVLGSQSIHQRAAKHAQPRDWEAGDLPWPTPKLKAAGLPAESIKALDEAWRILLRMAVVHYELQALADRHNADPPHKGLLLAFRIDEEHPYGRFLWTKDGTPISGYARQLAQGRHPGRIDYASMPDRLMRILGVPTPARRAISLHERERRRMARIYDIYVECLRGFLSTGPKRLKEAHELLLRAGYPEARSSDVPTWIVI